MNIIQPNSVEKKIKKASLIEFFSNHDISLELKNFTASCFNNTWG